MSDKLVMSDKTQLDESNSAADQGGERLEQMVHLLETDELGYRIERFVTREREGLAQKLTEPETFSLSLASGSTYADLFHRVQAYDVTILPYVEFFAVGAVYTRTADAFLWTIMVQENRTVKRALLRNLESQNRHHEKAT
jgi:hypothetical protein